MQLYLHTYVCSYFRSYLTHKQTFHFKLTYTHILMYVCMYIQLDIHMYTLIYSHQYILSNAGPTTYNSVMPSFPNNTTHSSKPCFILFSRLTFFNKYHRPPKHTHLTSYSRCDVSSFALRPSSGDKESSSPQPIRKQQQQVELTKKPKNSMQKNESEKSTKTQQLHNEFTFK